ncbi:acetate--CoA ligase [Pseudarthrobacter niigatensis]|uniref:acetate--CoA ligase n=1 Tax=Pseudarthrobacter niigatensis TaxID=369935 RepID=A0AAJ1SYG3_9MICC|nr:acetate--CoA ligase [Pseudarthrobacter niigatensis]MDQ0146072.1 acetyl-CoA synthetase [Pseudarthrobacter niigatensis]MDQ0266200.1 acetyl-CoA synthetase [Pseudarthrobacter niigatensis]
MNVSAGGQVAAAIAKDVAALRVRPNMLDYDAARRDFSWEQARQALAGLPGGRGVNIAYEAVDRHVAEGRGAKEALRFVMADGGTKSLSYGDLAHGSARFAAVLRTLEVGRGERVFSLLGRSPDLYTAVLGTFKNGSVFCPLFSAFGPEPVRQRLHLGAGRVLVTTRALYRRKVAPVRDTLPALRHVLLVDANGTPEPGTLDLTALLAQVDPSGEIAATQPEDMALLHFTSGTTGTPKGAIHVHDAVAAHYATGRFALDLHPDDIYWCTADPGWVTGTSYGIIAPLVHGVTAIVDQEELDADRWYRILAEQHVTVWYTAPTALRMLMKAGAERAAGHDLSALRFIASVGEPLNPEAVVWGRDVLGLPVHDNWWQTETGGIMIANYAAMDIRPGSMGRPLPGIEAALVARDADGKAILKDGQAVLVTEPDAMGELALRPGWPSMFRGYLNEDERYRRCFAGGWYLTGDLAKRDGDGYFWFVGRGDDVIKSSGHLIGPFEVESCLMEHPAVAEAGVIGVPDPVAGEVVKAFVELKTGNRPTEELQLEIIGFARKRLGAAVAPRLLDFTTSLPKTRSGKILRRLLKARELGLPEGDTSTLESPAGPAVLQKDQP